MKVKLYTVNQLVLENIIFKPIDGNHGNIHPKSNDYVNSGVPFVMASDIENGKIKLEKIKYISNDQASKLQKGFSIKGDILLTHKATIGRVAINNLDTPFIMLTPQVTYYRVKNFNILNNIFLKYYFEGKKFQKMLANYASSGSTRDYIGILEQGNLLIEIPEIEEQKAIVAVLSSLDD
ncbi:MAG: restriction endonuclease subunit S, partial [Patescibacteria group bacterium]